jgi:hypothetical protein
MCRYKVSKGLDYVIIWIFNSDLRALNLVIKRALPPVVSEPSSSVEKQKNTNCLIDFQIITCFFKNKQMRHNDQPKWNTISFVTLYKNTAYITLPRIWCFQNLALTFFYKSFSSFKIIWKLVINCFIKLFIF